MWSRCCKHPVLNMKIISCPKKIHELLSGLIHFRKPSCRASPSLRHPRHVTQPRKQPRELNSKRVPRTLAPTPQSPNQKKQMSINLAKSSKGKTTSKYSSPPFCRPQTHPYTSPTSSPIPPHTRYAACSPPHSQSPPPSSAPP